MNYGMKIVLSLAAGFWVMGASAQPMGGMSGMGMDGMGGMGLGGGGGAGCRNAADPTACEARRAAALDARRKATEACKDVVGPDRRSCIRDVRMAEHDCAAGAQPARCQQVKDAYAKCKAHAGPAMRACMHDELPPPDCGKAPDPKRCQAMNKAREACKDKPFGPARRDCMSQQPGIGK